MKNSRVFNQQLLSGASHWLPSYSNAVFTIMYTYFCRASNIMLIIFIIIVIFDALQTYVYIIVKTAFEYEGNQWDAWLVLLLLL